MPEKGKRKKAHRRRGGRRWKEREKEGEGGIDVVPSPWSSYCKRRGTNGLLGFPVLLKASAGGGGKGMRVVWKAEDMVSEIAAARRESRDSFGDDTLLLEVCGGQFFFQGSTEVQDGPS